MLWIVCPEPKFALYWESRQNLCSGTCIKSHFLYRAVVPNMYAVLVGKTIQTDENVTWLQSLRPKLLFINYLPKDMELISWSTSTDYSRLFHCVCVCVCPPIRVCNNLCMNIINMCPNNDNTPACTTVITQTQVLESHNSVGGETRTTWRNVDNYSFRNASPNTLKHTPTHAC